MYMYAYKYYFFNINEINGIYVDELLRHFS